MQVTQSDVINLTVATNTIIYNSQTENGPIQQSTLPPLCFVAAEVSQKIEPRGRFDVAVHC